VAIKSRPSAASFVGKASGDAGRGWPGFNQGLGHEIAHEIGPRGPDLRRVDRFDLQRRVECGRHRFLAFVAVRAASSSLGLSRGINGEHAKPHRDAGLQRDSDKALRHRVPENLVVTGLALDDAGQRDHRSELVCHRGG